jgi:hypothetical protein
MAAEDWMAAAPDRDAGPDRRLGVARRYLVDFEEDTPGNGRCGFG